MLATVFVSRAQFTDSSTGLLQMPSAEMQEDGTFMITNNFLNKHSLASGWNYNTFQYGICVSFWRRIELGYVCTIINGAWDPTPEAEKTDRQRLIRNQDRHFTGRICLFREGEFGIDWMPALVIGVSDPITGGYGGVNDYTELESVAGAGNGYFNRNYAVLSKHLDTHWGQVIVHAGYQFNHRNDYPINAPCFGVDWKPVWFQNKGFLEGLDCIVEYDSRSINVGVIVSTWDDHFEAMLEFQRFTWINFGLRYKIRLKK